MTETPGSAFRNLSEAEKAELNFIREAGQAFSQMILQLQSRRMQEFDKKLRGLQQLSAGSPAGNDTLMRVQVQQQMVLRACDISQQRIEESVMWALKALTQ